MESVEPHSRNLRVHRVADRPDTFFVTKCVQPRRSVLAAEARGIICSAFRDCAERRRIILAAFVVMPDHWHGLFGLLEEWTLPRFMHAFMSYVGGRTAHLLQAQGCHWQDGYYETRIRSAKQFEYVRGYIAWNPVRKGLVDTPEQWDASSLQEPALVSDFWPWGFEQD